MKTISCTGRYDGKVVQLDEKMDIPTDTPVIVTVLPRTTGEEAEWYQASLASVGGAYGERAGISVNGIKRAESSAWYQASLTSSAQSYGLLFQSNYPKLF